MERRASKHVVRDFTRILRLDDLINEYRGGNPVCPISGDEMVASEGSGRPVFDPFYWRCTNRECGYKRGIDQPRIKGNVITCANCGAEVEYGEWGSEPAWRCLVNRHHHQKVSRVHLLLPKMRAIVPKRELCKLDRLFGIMASKAPPKARKGQRSLWDSKPSSG